MNLQDSDMWRVLLTKIADAIDRNTAAVERQANSIDALRKALKRTSVFDCAICGTEDACGIQNGACAKCRGEL